MDKTQIIFIIAVSLMIGIIIGSMPCNSRITAAINQCRAFYKKQECMDPVVKHFLNTTNITWR